MLLVPYAGGQGGFSGRESFGDLLGGIFQAVSRNQVQSRLVQHFLGYVGVCSLKPDNNGKVQSDFFGSSMMPLQPCRNGRFRRKC